MKKPRSRVATGAAVQALSAGYGWHQFTLMVKLAAV